MRNSIIISIWVICISFFSNTIYSQNQLIAKSQVIENIDAKKYYIHTVQAKETAFAISRAYGISYSELLQHNPGIETGLSIGQTLKIPYTEQEQKNNEVPISQSKEVISVNNQDFIVHIVEQGQTVYSIARMYDIAPVKILETNPDYTENLPIGVKLIIPKIKQTQPVKQESIAEQSKVNDKKDTPQVSEKSKETSVVSDKKIDNNISAKQEQVREVVKEVSQKKQSVRIVLMLPFMLDINSKEYTEVEIINKQIQIHASTFPFIEYYEGVLLAVDSLRKKGISVQLEVFDSSKDSIYIQEILSEINTNNLDLIIGPVFPVAFSIASESAKKHKIPIVSPLSSEDIALKTNPYVIQVNSPQRYRFKEIAKFASEYKQCNVIFVYNSIELEQAQVQECKRIFSVYYPDSIKKNSITFKEVYFPKMGLDGVEKSLSNSSKNVIIVLSRNQAFINNLVTKLYQYSKKFDVHLVGLPMWEKYDNLELDFLFALQFQFVTNGYVDYTKDEVKKFIELYRTLYKTEPTKFSFQGYDQMMFFSELLSEYDDALLQKITQVSKTGLHDSYMFVREQSSSGIVNTSAQTVYYTKTFEKKYK